MVQRTRNHDQIDNKKMTHCFLKYKLIVLGRKRNIPLICIFKNCK